MESGLVGRLPGASVLPARLRIPGRAHSARFRQRDPGRGRVPDDRMDRVPGAWVDDLPGAHAGSPERLARAARCVRRAHALRRTQQRGRGGAHIGMLGARLSWALIPLLLLVLVPWIEEGGRPSRVAALILAAIVLTHPAMLPAAVTLIVIGAAARPPWRARLAAGLLGLAFAAALTAFWTVPLLFRLEHTRALAWGEAPTIGVFGAALALLALVGLARARGAGPSARVVALFPWAMVLVVLVDRFALEPLVLRWLPANRVVDGAWIAFIMPV